MSTDTREIPAPWLRPPVTATYHRRSPLARFLASAFVADVKSRLHIIPEAIGAMVVVYFGILILRGLAVAAEIAGVR